jgi:hypothetical protein
MSLSDSEEFSPRLEWGDIEDEYEVDNVDTPVYLDSPWTFWYDMYPGPGLTAEQYAGAMRKIATVDNIQDFWGIYNNLPGLESIPNKSSYHLMKYESLPLWEDQANINGGNFSFKIKRSDAEHVWVQMLVRVVGEQFLSVLHGNDDIQGISVNMRAGGEAAIYFWNKNAKLVDTSKMIRKIKEVLQGVDFLQEPSYRVHREEVNFNPSPRKPKSAGAKGTTSPKRGNSPPKASAPKKSPKKDEYSPKKESSYKKSYKASPPKHMQYVYVPISVHN